MFEKTILQKAKSAPHKPGCYIYRDSNQKVLYIGKAKDLYNRVNQYFHRFQDLEEKKQVMVLLIKDIEFVTVDNEIEALILESNLIKKYRPKYNTDLKDDKNYVWVKIDKNEDFPRITFSRNKDKNGTFYGPFPSKVVITSLLKKIRHVFPYRDCSRKIVYKNGKAFSSDPKPCLYYHIGLCSAPCADKISKTDYENSIRKIRSLLQGKTKLIMDTLEKEMYKLSETKRYENAAKVRDRLQEFKYISEQVIVDYGMDEDDLKIAKEERTMKALAQFVQKLKLPEVKLRNGFKIECYDISNIQGKNATGSMIVFVDGKPKKSFYRKFRIRAKDTPDDFLMMQEMLTRRLARIDSDDKSFSEIPDVMIIDGGKGQLSSAFEILQDSIHQIPLISLAKREEELFIPKLDLDNKLKYRKVILPRNSQELYLIQRIRDEAHRFAITYHRNLRSKSQITTTLDSIPGIGPKTKKKLLLKYGSFEGIRKAKKNDLKKIINNTRAYEEILKKL